ncbi:MAG: NAD(P)-dependent oxidoreductase [Eubacteriales bacterium]|nr:NAD(P)-dependent oxidoreductase [Eubacteriales bacterium]
MKKIGFIGLGDMGIFMSRNLIRAGYSVKGFDVSEERMKQFQQNGGIVCKTNAQVGTDIDVAIIMVVTAQQVETVLFGENGLMEKMRPGSRVIIAATIGDKPMMELAERAAAKDVQIIDCAVTGGQIGAEAGSLAMMIAAPKADFEACRDIFDVLGKTIVYVGERPGMGQTVKNCNGVMSALSTVAVCEAMALGAKAGVDPKIVAEVLGNGSCGSPLFRNYAEKIISRKFSGGGVQLKLLYKDTNLVMEMATRLGIPLYGTSVCNEVIHAAMARFPGEDCWSPVKLYEEITGVPVESEE